MNTIARQPMPSPDLVRIGERVSFIYLDRCTVGRDANGISVSDQHGVTHIPAAAVSVLLLGPGTTVTQQAMLLLADSGATAVWVGEHGVRYYAHGTPLSRSSRLLEAQAAAVSNRRTRLRVARAMYGMRFPGEDTSALTMQQLRGREGARVRQMYRSHADRSGVAWTGRNYSPENWAHSDPVNQALSAANAALYGAVHAVVVALGCSPGLGFIHTGHQRSFVYDIADLYKNDITVPVAFDAAAEEPPNIASHTRRAVRDRLSDGKLLTRCVRDINALLLAEPSATDDADLDEVFDDLSLWDDRGRNVPAATLYRDDQR